MTRAYISFLRAAMTKEDILSNAKLHTVIGLLMVGPLFFYLFRPSWLQFFTFFAIDSAALLIIRPFEFHLFLKAYPLTRLFFPEISPELRKRQRYEEKREVYQAISAFPALRTRRILVWSFFKIIPAMVYILWVVAPGDPLAILKIAFIVFFTFSFGVVVTLLAYQKYMSEILRIIHERYDWSDVFREVEVRADLAIWPRPEIFGCSVVFLFFVSIACFIILQTQDPLWLSIGMLIFTALATFYSVVRIVSNSRRLVMLGLQDLVLEQTEKTSRYRESGVALSVNPSLAFYQQAVNKLVEHVTHTEREANLWMLRTIEDDRFRGLGEAAALMVHDQIAPLSTMKHALDILAHTEAPNLVENRHFQIAREALDHEINLVTNLRTLIRGGAEGSRASLLKALAAARTISSYRGGREAYGKVRFEFAIDADIGLAISQVELSQIFCNLFQNSIQNFAMHDLGLPTIRVALAEESPEQVILSVTDNGSGLSSTVFEEITGQVNRVEGGAGLSLTRKLAQRHDGELKVVDNPASSAGTEFRLTLRKSLLPLFGNEA